MKNVVNKTWFIILMLLLFANIALHICGIKTELNYYASVTCALSCGLYIADIMGEYND